jgi:uncharacterized HhH-GPD family protein
MARHHLHLSGDPVADALLSTDPLALLIGMVLDQQIPLEWAFRGPAEMAQRLGMAPPLDAGRLASMDPDVLTAAFSARPALHRYPASMAARVQALCRAVVDDYGGDAAAVWKGAADGKQLRTRVQSLPGFGEQKARIFVALLGKQLGVHPSGWVEASSPFGEPGSHRSIADIVDAESLATVREYKAAAKAAAKEAAASGATGTAAEARASAGSRRAPAAGRRAASGAGAQK